MAALLILEALAQRFHQLVKAAQRLDLGFFFIRQVFFGHFGQPLGGDIDGVQNLIKADLTQPVEAGGKGAVELVDITLILHHRHAGEVVERLDIIGCQTLFHPLQKGQEFA